MTAFRIKKGQLVGLGSWLNEQQLSGRKSRERTRFVEDIQEELRQVEAARIALLEEHAEIDAEGKPVKEAVEGGQERYKLTEEATAEFQKAYSDLLSEDWIVDITEANREQISTVSDIVLNTDYRFGPRDEEPSWQREARMRQMNDYPHWCEAFEQSGVQQ
jgi:hypothetical protein